MKRFRIHRKLNSIKMQTPFRRSWRNMWYGWMQRLTKLSLKHGQGGRECIKFGTKFIVGWRATTKRRGRDVGSGCAGSDLLALACSGPVGLDPRNRPPFLLLLRPQTFLKARISNPLHSSIPIHVSAGLSQVDVLCLILVIGLLVI